VVARIVVAVLCAISMGFQQSNNPDNILVMRMTTAPAMKSFDSRTDHWNLWSRCLKQWLTLSPYSEGDGSEAKQCAALSTYIDYATFKLLCGLCTPKKPEKLTFTQLNAKLNGHYGSKKLLLAKCYVFYNYK